MIRSKKLKIFKGISHGFFNKNGGKSEGIYKSLNCGLGSKDKKNNIKKNLKIVKKKFVSNLKIFTYYIKFIVINLFLLTKILILKRNSKQML